MSSNTAQIIFWFGVVTAEKNSINPLLSLYQSLEKIAQVVEQAVADLVVVSWNPTRAPTFHLVG